MGRTNAQVGAQEERPWAVYARLSRAASGDLEKVEYQEELCRRYAESRGLPVADEHVYVDNSLSAWKKRVRRPSWEALMEVAGRGEISGVLVYAVDRFTRRPKDLEALIELAEDHGLAIEGPRSGRLDLTTATGRQQARWMALQAASESDNTSERIKTTLARKMREGKPMGGGRPFGFEVGGMVQRPAEVAVIREMAARLLAGEPLQKLAADMNARGLRTVRGGEWTGANLGRMLDGHRYGGLVEHHGEIVGTMPGEPILDRDTYDSVQALMASRRRGRRPTGRFLLTGLMTCGRCGHALNGATRYRKLANGTRVQEREYRCPLSLGGCGRAILAAPVEAMVDDYMIGVLADPTNQARIEAEKQQLNDARRVLLAEKAAIEEQLTNLEVKKANGEILDVAYNAALPVWMKKWKAVDAALTAAPPVEGSASGGAVRRRKASAQDVARAAQTWADMETDERRLEIKGFRARIEIMPKDSRVQRFDSERVRITHG